MKYWNYIILLALAAGCRPAKKLQGIEKAITQRDTAAGLIAVTAPKVDSFSIVEKIIGNLDQRRIEFKTFYAKVKIDYEGKESSDQATAFIRMQKDSIIWISLVGALGIEGARLLITKDSVKLINKLQKTVKYDRITYLEELAEVPVDFFGLQDVIIGNPIFIDTSIVSYKETGSDLMVLMTGNIFKHLITLNVPDFRIKHSKLDDADVVRNRTCDITYDEYKLIEGRMFSTKRRITIAEKSKLDINLEFKQVNFEQALEFPFNIPKNFRRR